MTSSSQEHGSPAEIKPDSTICVYRLSFKRTFLKNPKFTSKCDSELKMFAPNVLVLRITQSKHHYFSQSLFVTLRCQCPLQLQQTTYPFFLLFHTLTSKLKLLILDFFSTQQLHSLCALSNNRASQLYPSAI